MNAIFGATRWLYWLGVICMALCLIDVLLVRIWRIDVTGQAWSSLPLGGAGIILMQVSRFFKQPSPEDEEELI